MDTEHLHPVMRQMPADWRIVRVDDLFAIQQGKQVSARHRAGDRQRPFLRTKNVYWGRLDLTELDVMHFSQEDEQRLRLLPGDLLTCEGGWVGRTAMWRGEVADCLYQNHLHRLRRLANDTDPRFALFWLWYAFDIGGIYFGRQNVTTIPNLSKSRLGELPMPSPSAEEQREISAVLSAVQRMIGRHERLVVLTAELKNALMHKLFTEGTRGEPLKQTEIGPVPESWSVDRLDSFCLLQRGFDITKDEQSDGSVPVVSSGGIKSYHNVAKVAGPGVVVGRKGTLGTVHYVDGPYWPHDTTLWVKDFKANDPRFTAYFLDRLDFARFDSGASNPTLNRNTIHAETVAYPPKEQQYEIAVTLSTIEQKIDVHQRYLASLRSLFRAILHQLMTAEIRVRDLDLSALNKAEPEPFGAV
jgi:type I restriction enzyme S subunit